MYGIIPSASIEKRLKAPPLNVFIKSKIPPELLENMPSERQDQPLAQVFGSQVYILRRIKVINRFFLRSSSFPCVNDIFSSYD